MELGATRFLGDMGIIAEEQINTDSCAAKHCIEEDYRKSEGHRLEGVVGPGQGRERREHHQECTG